MASGNFSAGIVSPPLTVNQFFSPPPVTPGNVGVCLSGGGSRALTAGMGQLQALAHLTANGAPLLGQVKALSTVSGGSWLGVPFEYLRPSGPTDNTYLGVYNSSQASLTINQLQQVPAGNAGAPITSDLFLPELLAVEALLLYEVLDVPPPMLWQTVIALNILRVYGLFAPGLDFEPTDLFTYDAQSLQNTVTGPNPALTAVTADLFADTTGTNRIHRPFLICNMGMFLDEPGTKVESLAPVQATPFFTGIVGTPGGTDANGLAVGGGGITSFAFNSLYVNTATVAQQRQWSLTDIVGTSSAFFAEILQNQIAEWEQNPWKFFETLHQYFDEILKWIEHHFDPVSQVRAKTLVKHHLLARTVEDLAVLKFSFPDLQAIEPAYFYWSPAHETVVTSPKPTRFADGGNLENTGIGGMLAYSDIDKLISFVNTEIPMAAAKYGVSDGKGGYIPGTYIEVDESIPPLFGYQPYESGEVNEYNKGYVLYAGASRTDYPMYANNQVFPSAAFPTFLQQIWANSESGSAPAIYAQSLPVLQNKWFGVTGGKTVTVVWCYLAMVSAWQDQFKNNPAVAAAVKDAVSKMAFPHYNTVDTSLSALDVNLLAALTGWCVVTADQQSKVFSGLFSG